MARRRVQHHLPDRSRRAFSTSTARSTRGFRTKSTPARTISQGYDEPLFPVADTPIGRIGCAICYDWLFPEAIRQLAANGAEILIRVSAYMDPWGATEPMDWWTVVNRCRALENIAFVVAANQGASLQHYPPYSWPGGSQVDRLRRPRARRRLARARRADRRRAHRCVRAAPRARDAARASHARRTCAPRRTRCTRKPMYPAAGCALSYEANNERIDRAKARFDELSRRRVRRSQRRLRGGETMIRKLQSGEYRLYSRKKDPKTGDVATSARSSHARLRKSTSAPCSSSNGTRRDDSKPPAGGPTAKPHRYFHDLRSAPAGAYLSIWAVIFLSRSAPRRAKQCGARR